MENVFLTTCDIKSQISVGCCYFNLFIIIDEGVGIIFSIEERIFVFAIWTIGTVRKNSGGKGQA